MKVILTTQYREGYSYWSENDERKIRKIDRLFRAICADPFKGIGKPEPLRHQLRRCWSRRIDGEHRIIYLVEGDTISFLSCRGHYK